MAYLPTMFNKHLLGFVKLYLPGSINRWLTTASGTLRVLRPEQPQASWGPRVIPRRLCEDPNHPDSVLVSNYKAQETSSFSHVVQFTSENVPPSSVLNKPFLQHQSKAFLTVKIGNEYNLLILPLQTIQ